MDSFGALFSLCSIANERIVEAQRRLYISHQASDPIVL
jgi:hypothetical protein